MSVTISIIITTYNRQNYLNEAIASVLAQTWQDFELIIWDDGSSDRTVEIAESYAKRDRRVRVIADEHRGRSAALRGAFAQTKGRFIGYVDSDDLLAPTALEETLAVMEANPLAGFVYTDYIDIDPNGQEIGYGQRCRVPYSPEILLRNFMTFHFRLIRRSVYEQVGGIDESCIYAEDYDLCLKLSEVAEVKHINKPLYYYRTHQQTTSHQYREQQAKDSVNAIAQALNRRGLSELWQVSLEVLSQLPFKSRIKLALKKASEQLVPKALLMAAVPLFAAMGISPALAQPITPAQDGTGTIVNTNGDRFDITGGTRSSNGANLFHSFTEFGLNQNQIANFLSQPDILNILGRINGGNPSIINGLIQVTGGNSNLFLMNPSGILFGPNASLNVPASFTATSATSIGFGNDKWFNASGPNNYAAFIETPTNFGFGTLQPGAIFSAANLAVTPGNNLNLVGGTVISTGQLSAPGGGLVVASVPGEKVIRISQPGHLLSLEISPPSSPVTALSLPELLTGNAAHTSGVTVNNNTVQLTNSGIAIQTGDVVAKNIQAQTATLSANRNLTLVESQLGTAGDMNLLAKDTVRIRDGVQNPFIAWAGGNLTIQGDRSIDILALNHLSQTPFFSLGDLSLISDGIISGDSHFASLGNFSIKTLSGDAAKFISLYDPIISANGDVTIAGDYIGVALKIEATGSITGNNFTITNLDDFFSSESFCSTSSSCSADARLLGTSAALIMRAGLTTLQEPSFGYGGPPSFINVTGRSASSGGATFSGSRIPTKPGTITVNNLTTAYTSTRAAQDGGPVILSAVGDIRTGVIDTSFLPTTETGNAGNISITSTQGSITLGTTTNPADPTSIFAFSNTGNGGAVTLNAAGNINSGAISSRAGVRGGDINITSQNGAIAISSSVISGERLITPTSEESPIPTTVDALESGVININAPGDITVGGIIARGATISRDINVTSSNGNININAAPNVPTLGILTSSINGNPGNVTLNSPNGNINAFLINTQGIIRGGDVKITALGNVQALSSLRTVLGPSPTGFPALIDLNSSIATSSNGQAGSVTIQASNINIAGIGSGSLSGNGGTIALNATQDITTKDLISRSQSASGGAITLVAGRNITASNDSNVIFGSETGAKGGTLNINNPGFIDFDIANGAFAPGGADTLIGNITPSSNLSLPSGINLDTQGGSFTAITAGDFDLGASVNTRGGNFSLTSNGVLTTEAFINTAGGSINLRGTSINSNGVLNSSNNTVSGNGGAIALNATNQINTVAIDSRSSNGNGGAIAINTNGNITTTNSIQSSSNLGNAGNVSITSNQGAITLGTTTNPSEPTSIFAVSNTANGGAVTLNAAENISSGAISSRARVRGGDINITSQNGAIAVSSSVISGDRLTTPAPSESPSPILVNAEESGAININASSDITLGGIIARGATISRDINVTSSNGNININAAPNVPTLGILTSSINGNAGNVTLSTPKGNINAFLINTQGINRGGNVNINASGNFQALSSLRSVFGPNPSGFPGSIDLDSSIATFSNNLSGSVTVQAGNINIAGINSGSLTGNGGAIALTSAQNISSNDLISRSQSGPGGAITLSAGQNITFNSNTDIRFGSDSVSKGGTLTINNPGATNFNLENFTFSAGGADTIIGNITAPSILSLPSGININTEGGSFRATTAGGLDFGAFVNTAGGDFSLTSNGILTTQQAINTSGGAITLTGTSITANGILNSRNLATEGGRNGGAIALNANDRINIVEIDSRSTNNNGGAIALVTKGDININSSLQSSSDSGNAGNISITSETGKITTNGIAATSANQNGGNVNISAFGDIIANPLVVPPTEAASIFSSGTEAINTQGGSPNLAINTQGGNISLSSQSGAITTGDLNAQGINTGNGGNINIMALTQITAGAIDSSSVLGNGGSVNLDPIGDIQVALINAQGGLRGTGGNVSIATQRFFRATDSFIDRNQINASISTAGGNQGGTIEIRHAGGTRLLLTPFVVGVSTNNGTVGAITRGNTSSENTISTTPPKVFPGSHFQDNNNIRIITENPPIPPRPETPPSIPRRRITNDDRERPVQERPRNRINFVGNIPRITSVDRSIPRIDRELANDFQQYFGSSIDRSITSQREPREILTEIEDSTGIRPALIYVSFIPQTIGPSANKLGGKDTLANEKIAQASQLEQPNNSKRDSDELELLIVTGKESPARVRVPGVTRSQVIQVTKQFRTEVSSSRRSSRFLAPAKQLYQWIVAPIEGELQKRNIQNLVFLMDGGLRSLPVAALHDGNQFLVEKYSAGLMPSLNLTDTRYKDIRNAEVLGMGASTFPADQEQPDLPAVGVELQTIAPKLWPGKTFINEAFTIENLKAQRRNQPFGIVHLATHGEFKPGGPENSFIQMWDTKLRLDQMRQLELTNPPVELLVLSACKSAIGNEQAELGFAGVSIAAGVKSTLASLWYVSDEATLGLMTDFYQQLRKAPIKSEALRQTQIAFLKKQVRFDGGKLITPFGNFAIPPAIANSASRDLSHPYYWAGFTMVGNPW